jgi:hypothetical protein
MEETFSTQFVPRYYKQDQLALAEAGDSIFTAMSSRTLFCLTQSLNMCEVDGSVGIVTTLLTEEVGVGSR